MNTNVSLVTIVALVAGTADAQSRLVVPTAVDAATPGNAAADWPWDRTDDPLRIQYCYDASHFTSRGIDAPIWITGVRFRAQEAWSASWSGGTHGRVIVSGGPAAFDHTALTTVFAANWLGGAEPPPAHDGAVVVAPGSVHSAVQPGPWYVTIEFSNAITYDPTTGADLLLEYQCFGIWSGGSVRDSDAVTVPDPLVGRVRNLTDPRAATGIVQSNVGLVCELAYYGGAAAGGFEAYGTGCPGSNGTAPTLASAGGASPRLGTTFTFAIASAAPSRDVFVLIGFAPLPGLDLSPVGMDGCRLWSDIVVSLATTADTAGTAAAELPIPGDPGNLGRLFTSQGLVVDPGANALGAVVSNGGIGQVGP